MCLTETVLGRRLLLRAGGVRNTQSLRASPAASPKRLCSRTENGSVLWSEQFWRPKQRSETAYWPRGHSLSALRALPGPGRVSVGPSEGPKVGGTGHSRMELLWRVLAEGESAPSARKYDETGIWSEFHMKPHKAPRMASGPTAWRRLCEARSLGEPGAGGPPLWRERRGGREGREGRGSADSGPTWRRWVERKFSF